MAHDAEENAKEVYLGNMLWLVVQEIAAFGGTKPNIPAFSDLFGRKNETRDTRTAQQIVGGLASRLKKRRREAKNRAKPV